MNTDLINGLWEFSGCLFVCHGIYEVLKDKAVRGLSWPSLFFFTTWGAWNVYFYPQHDLFWSMVGGMCLAGTNVVYLTLVLYYKYFYGRVKNENSRRRIFRHGVSQ